MVNQKSDQDFCPEEHRDDRPLFPKKDFCPERPSEARDLSPFSPRYVVASLLPRPKELRPPIAPTHNP
jgi:hypothetical protein